MQLEGIHHVTAITGDAPRNVDFYARVLGLRLVKKTVNQDDPTVYHLFYADEHGSPGSDITFFEYPGAARGRAGRRDGAHGRVARRLRRRARLLGAAARRRGASTSAHGRAASRSRIRKGCGTSSRLATRGCAARRRAPRDSGASMALQGFDGVRAFADDARDAAARCSRRRSASTPRARTAWEARGATRGGLLRLRRAAGGARASGAPAPSTTSLGRNDRGARGVAARGDAQPGMHPTPVIDRFWFRSDLLPRAERRPVRARDARPGLRGRRGSRAPRRER